MAGDLQLAPTRRTLAWRAAETVPRHHRTTERTTMLRAALAFFIIAIIAGVFGFTGIAAGAAGIAKILFWGFVILAVLALVGGLALGRRW
jgi:uncharacterized membrane protein YtjA (UPF0391 family)